jgi:hypothetical protein
MGTRQLHRLGGEFGDFVVGDLVVLVVEMVGCLLIEIKELVAPHDQIPRWPSQHCIDNEVGGSA